MVGQKLNSIEIQPRHLESLQPIDDIRASASFSKDRDSGTFKACYSGSETVNEEYQKTSVSFILNDAPQNISVNPLSRFSEVLREDLGLTGTKVGCDAGDCGACTIQIDGEQRYACLTAVAQLEGCNVRTVEGLSKNGKLTPLQQAFLDEGAAQCGICTPGMLMAAQSSVGSHTETPLNNRY